MFINIVSTISLLLALCKGQNNTITTTIAETNQTLPVTTYFESCKSNETVDPTAVAFLSNTIDGQLNLTIYVSKWNVSLLVKYINESNPTMLTSKTTMGYLTEYIPKCVIVQFPKSILLYLGYCEFLPNITKYQQNCSQSDDIDTDLDFCVGPLVHSNRENPVQKEFYSDDFGVTISMKKCGLSCKSGELQYGLTTEEQHVIDIFKYIGFSLCIIFVCILAFLLYINQKQQRDNQDRPLLHDIPYAITASLFLEVFCLVLGEVIGKEYVVCSDNPNSGEDREFSFDNPIYGENGLCTIVGMVFYSSLLFYASYTVLLSFVIFRQLYVPMNPLWKIPKKYWHLMIAVFVIAMEVFTLIDSAYSGLYPMSICVPGGNNKVLLLVTTCLPLMIASIFTFIFLVLGSYLLHRQVNAQISVADTAVQLQDLMIRMVFYSVTVEICLILLTATAMVFYSAQDDINKSNEEMITCELTSYLVPSLVQECKPSYRVNIFWFISWVIASVLASSAQLFLACHTETRRKLKLAPQEIVSQLGRVTSLHHSPRSSPNNSNMDTNTGDMEMTRTSSKNHSSLGDGTTRVDRVDSGSDHSRS